MIDTIPLAMIDLVYLVNIPGPGDIADSIISALQDFIKGIFEDGFFKLLGISLNPFLDVVNPATSGKAVAAWQSSFKIAIALFPLMIVIGLLSMPWADRQKAHLWRQGFRMVTVVLMIALSKPLIGIGVDATNAVTMQLAPQNYEIAFSPGNYGFDSLPLIAAYFVTAVLLLFALPGAIMALSLRTYIIYIVFLSSPILAVFWYPDWGFGKHINKFATKIGRMGIYCLLAGPLLAIALRSMKVIIAGGLIGASNASGVTRFWTQLVLVIMTPFVLIAIITKAVSWAGQPMGIGNAYNMASSAALAAAAGSLGSAVGTMSSSTSGGGGDRSGSSSSGADNTAGTSAEGGESGSTPRSAIDNGTLDDQMDGDVQSAGTERPQSHFDDVADRTPNVSDAVGNIPDAGREKVSNIRQKARGQGPLQRAQKHKDDAEWLDEQIENQRVDLDEAYERGILDENPEHPGEKKLTNSGMIGYETEDGEWQMIDVEAKQEHSRAQAKRWATVSHGAKKSATAAATSLKAGKKAGQATKAATKATLRYGAYGMRGHAPVLAYNNAKQRSQNDTKSDY